MQWAVRRGGGMKECVIILGLAVIGHSACLQSATLMLEGAEEWKDFLGTWQNYEDIRRVPAAKGRSSPEEFAHRMTQERKRREAVLASVESLERVVARGVIREEELTLIRARVSRLPRNLQRSVAYGYGPPEMEEGMNESQGLQVLMMRAQGGRLSVLKSHVTLLEALAQSGMCTDWTRHHVLPYYEAASRRVLSISSYSQQSEESIRAAKRAESAIRKIRNSHAPTM